MPELQRSTGVLHYEVSGRNHAPALVLLHPLGASSGIWLPQLAEFERFFHVVRIDLRGHGKSRLEAGDPTPCSIADLAADALAVLDHLGIERAHFCGLSIGGITALQVAIRSPRRVLRLVLANTAASFPPASNWEERIETARSKGLEPLQAGVPERWFSPVFRQSDPAAVECVMELLKATQVRGYIEACGALRDADLVAALPEVMSPTLVIAGALDGGTSVERAEQLVAGISGADLVVLDASHLSNVEQAEDFTTTVVDFLRD